MIPDVIMILNELRDERGLVEIELQETHLQELVVILFLRYTGGKLHANIVFCESLHTFAFGRLLKQDLGFLPDMLCIESLRFLITQFLQPLRA